MRRFFRFAGSCLALLLGLAACTVPTAPITPQPTRAPDAADRAPPPVLADGLAVAQTVESRPVEGSLPFSRRGWDTDFTKRIVDFGEIRSGGPPKDGIPALDRPTFEDVNDASAWLTETDPVIAYESQGAARAYPLAILTWHEIVNDEFNGQPITVTFCPLCNASIVFDRRVGSQVLDFGTTGNLRNSDLVMYDRQTESWWQQFTGQAIIGELASTQLRFLASQVLAFGDFKALFPAGEVLQRPLDEYSRSYGTNPYGHYDTYGNPLSNGGRLMLFDQVPDNRLEPLARVVGVLFPDQSSVAIPFAAARAAGVVHYAPGPAGKNVVVFHQPGMSSALAEPDIGSARDIGSVGVFASVVDGQALEFSALGPGEFTDAQTGSRWNIRGQAVAGELEGRALTPLVAFDHFWFAWAAFLPDTELFEPT